MADRRGRAAKAKVELSETEAAFAMMRAKSFELIAASKPNEADFRERLYVTVQVIDALRKHLSEIVDDGRIEEYEQTLREAHG